MSFDDVLVHASGAVPQRTVNRLQPFDTNRSQKYSAEYLQGFSATQYVGSGKECWHTAQEIMYGQIKSRILSQYVYDVIGSFDVKMNCRKVTYKYVLLPIYIGNYSYKQKLYNFFVNGRNGKVDGKTPISPIRVIAVILAFIAVIIGLVALFMALGGD